MISQELERVTAEAVAELRHLTTQNEQLIISSTALLSRAQTAERNVERLAGELKQSIASVSLLQAEVDRLTAELAKRPPAPSPPPGPIEVSPDITVALDGFETFRPGLTGEKQGAETRYSGMVGDVRIILDLKSDGQKRTIIERCGADLPVLAPALSTRLQIKVGSTVRHDDAFRLHPHTRPTKVLDASRPPSVSAASLLGYIKGAVLPNYAPSAKPSETDLEKIADRQYPWDRWTGKGLAYDRISEEFGLINSSWSGGAGALLNEAAPLMPAQVAYLFSGDPRAWEAVRQLADSSGNYAIHYKINDSQGGHFPYAEETDFLPFLQGPEQVMLKTARGIVLPIPEPAHEHSLTYLAALLTGDRYYREELWAWASYNLLTRPKRPERLQGIMWSGQVRAAAWSLRALLHAALAEEWSNSGTYYASSLRENLRWMTATFATPGAKEYRPTGVTALQDFKPTNLLQYVTAEPKPSHAVATWNHHILAFELSECVRAGFHEAIPMRDHVLKVIEGVWRHSPSRFDIGWGNHAYPRDDWQTAVNTTFAGRSAASIAFPTITTPDYIAWSRSALVAAVDAGQAWAGPALKWVDEEAPRYKGGIPPVWKINPTRAYA